MHSTAAAQDNKPTGNSGDSKTTTVDGPIYNERCAAPTGGDSRDALWRMRTLQRETLGRSQWKGRESSRARYSATGGASGQRQSAERALIANGSVPTGRSANHAESAKGGAVAMQRATTQHPTIQSAQGTCKDALK